MTIHAHEKELLAASKKYGTPSYVFFPDVLAANVLSFKDAFEAAYPNTHVCYAVKTNFIPEVVACAYKAGAFPEIVPGIELDVVRELGILDERTVVNGPLKAEEELRLLVEKGSIINVDNCTELALLNKIGEEFNAVVKCGLRIKRNASAENWSRFGFNIDDGEANQLLRHIRKNFTRVAVSGVHFHMGTNNNSLGFYADSSRIVCQWAKLAHKEGILDVDYLDFGGGFSSASPLKKDKEGWCNPTDKEFAAAITAPLLEAFQTQERPRLIVEPGRRLVDDSFVFLTKVERFIDLQEKEIIVDGTMSMFPSSVHRAHPVSALGKSGDTTAESYKIYGGSPVHFDCFSEDMRLPKLEIGDVLAVGNAGAYSLNMAADFSRYLPKILLYEGHNMRELYRARNREDIFDSRRSAFLKLGVKP